MLGCIIDLFIYISIIPTKFMLESIDDLFICISVIRTRFLGIILVRIYE